MDKQEILNKEIVETLSRQENQLYDLLQLIETQQKQFISLSETVHALSLKILELKNAMD